jgi:hypothetical protein
MKCRKCDAELKKYNTGDVAGIVPIHALYCPNGMCELAGFLVVCNPAREGYKK